MTLDFSTQFQLLNISDMFAKTVKMIISTRLQHLFFNPVRPSDEYMQQWTVPSLVQLVDSCLFNTKPLHGPMVTFYHLDHLEQSLLKSMLCKFLGKNVWWLWDHQECILHSIPGAKEVRLRVLQWKIIHNIYPTRILLYKMGNATDSSCLFLQG